MKRDKLNHIIVGCNGEVGSSLTKFLCKKTNVYGIEKNTEFGPYPDKFDVMHITISYKPHYFEYCIKKYQKRFKPALTIIHSTVPVGVCDSLQVVHSPIRGIHPKLHLGIKHFVKYFGGKNAQKAADLFKPYGVKVWCVERAKDTEALKLWDTAQFGWQIILMKEIHAWCKKHKVDFDLIYRIANQHYNAGYRRLGRPEVVRPYLFYKKGKIGGHCVMSNLELLPCFVSSVIKHRNKKI